MDGVEVTDVYSGESMGARVETDAIQELQIVSGTFNAEYGRAMSGIVNVITKDGTQKYTGKINAYVGDYYSTNDVYGVLTRVDTVRNPVTELLEEKDILDNPLDSLNLIVNTDFSLSGFVSPSVAPNSSNASYALLAISKSFSSMTRLRASKAFVDLI